jgi:hypothetical protein
MEIIKKETIRFSQKESDACDMVQAMLEGIQRECSDPRLAKLANDINCKLYDLYDYLEDDD